MQAENTEAPIIVGKGGASGEGWSELKDIECTQRYSYIKQAAMTRAPNAPREKTSHDDAYQCGSFLHAARAKWFELGQGIERSVLEQCFTAGAEECKNQGYECTELNKLEYSLLFTNYANYWARLFKPKPYAVEYYLAYDWGDLSRPLRRSTRLDDVCYYPDAGGYCIGEFKTTYTLSGALKFYNEFNPQILLQQLLYKRAESNGRPEIKGTMVDIWDKYKLKGTRQFIALNERRLEHFERWLVKMLKFRDELMHSEHINPERNFMVCNTFNDAYDSQCSHKERCMKDE